DVVERGIREVGAGEVEVVAGAAGGGRAGVGDDFEPLWPGAVDAAAERAVCFTGGDEVNGVPLDERGAELVEDAVEARDWRGGIDDDADRTVGPSVDTGRWGGEDDLSLVGHDGMGVEVVEGALAAGAWRVGVEERGDCPADGLCVDVFDGSHHPEGRQYAEGHCEQTHPGCLPGLARTDRAARGPIEVVSSGGSAPVRAEVGRSLPGF